MNFLLLTDVLDHDLQMARLLLTEILSIITAQAGCEWDKVEMLHLVCDCGPHFRSREAFAFFLHDLVEDFGVSSPCP